MLAQLSWTMERVEARLRIGYTVFNGDFDRIHVADAVVVPRGDRFARVSDRLIVLEAGGPGEKRPGEVLLIRGSVPSDRPSLNVPPASYTPLEPGQSLSATVDVPWPLEAWHPLGGVGFLGQPRSVELQVEIFALEPPAWLELPGVDGAPIRVPSGELPAFLSAGARPLP